MYLIDHVKVFGDRLTSKKKLRIQVCPKEDLRSYCEDGIRTLNPTLGRGLDS